MPPSIPPVIYRKSRVASVLYAVALGTVQRHLEGTGLVPVSLSGLGLVNAAWFDYGTSSIGAYRELSLGVIASVQKLRPRAAIDLLLGRAGPIGAYVVALPVDSEVARSGGVKLYGLPKTLVDFSFDWSKSELFATVTDAGRRVLSMQVPRRLGLPAWLRQLVIYSQLDGRLLTTTIATHWLAQIDLVGHPRLTVEDRSHPLCQLVTEMGLQSARSLAIIHGQLRYAELPLPCEG
jgi:hypothetical protein